MEAASVWARGVRAAALLLGLGAAVAAATDLQRRIERRSVPLVEVGGAPHAPVRPFCRAVDGEWSLEPVHQRLELRIGARRCRAIVGVPALECSGRAVPVTRSPVVVDGEPALPLEWVLGALWPGALSDGRRLQLDVVTPARISVLRPRRPSLERMSARQVARHLERLQSPIDGAAPPRRGRWLPGASRDYRSGVHEGFDFFQRTDGKPLEGGTPVLSMTAGVVVRADHTYQEIGRAERDALLEEARHHAHTPDWILDRMHGRSVVVRSTGAVTVRYSHLSGVRERLTVGSDVAAGELLGWVGNSGTNAATVGSDWGAHLHCDIHIAGWPFWKYLTRAQARWVLAQALDLQL